MKVQLEECLILIVIFWTGVLIFIVVSWNTMFWLLYPPSSFQVSFVDIGIKMMLYIDPRPSCQSRDAPV